MRVCRPPPHRVTSASSIECPCQESNLVYDLRRVACVHHTPRTSFIARANSILELMRHRASKYPAEESNLARLLRRQSCVLHTRRALRYPVPHIPRPRLRRERRVERVESRQLLTSAFVFSAPHSTHKSCAQRKARDSNPHDQLAARFSKPARQALSGYLP